jgi:hypothetical protein
VLEGNVTANDNGALLAATDMHHIMPRAYPMTLDGDAKVWLIARK